MCSLAIPEEDDQRRRIRSPMSLLLLLLLLWNIHSLKKKQTVLEYTHSSPIYLILKSALPTKTLATALTTPSAASRPNTSSALEACKKLLHGVHVFSIRHRSWRRCPLSFIESNQTGRARHAQIKLLLSLLKHSWPIETRHASAEPHLIAWFCLATNCTRAPIRNASAKCVHFGCQI